MAQKKKFKFSLDAVISWGATVVIVGAMAKILHWPGGELIIGVGLATEAVLFFIMGFVPPHKDPQWDKVYPQLSEDFAGASIDTTKAVKLNELEIKGSAGGGLPDLKIGDDVVAKIKEGLDNFSNKVASISNSADASIATKEFSDNLKTASSKAVNLSSAFDQATAGVSEIAGAAQSSKEYHHQINTLGKSISALNAVYELELQDSSAHLKSMNKFYQNLSQTMSNFNESMDDSKQFKEEVAKLSKNLSSLNAVYGNMLSAMNQPRA
ncbi:type IX secretion system motor protein PorL/GldL [Pedobacter cryophilus]|uniref:Gliding motility protein GldL n=1 Tax=Pedobacter cryophilus TaxID=2571271 RepID=A0A4V5NZI9_9SPHI|nr:gliding motility protein GldL [Pedobacter cryophilus]TKC00221.1 gliding motility protein GldL [Pedobacter cryophilus]